jgi:hypothetical protein
MDLLKNSVKDIPIIGVGCLGHCYAEPLVEVILKDDTSIFYGNLTASEKDIENILSCGNSKRFEIPQERKALEKSLVLALAGKIDPTKYSDYIANGGYEGLKRALSLSREEVVNEIKLSGLRGRGGGGFPTGMKWSFLAAKVAKEEKFKGYQETLKTYIGKVDSEVVAAYEQAAGVSAVEGVSLTDEGEEPGRTWRDNPTPKFGVHYVGWNRYYPINEAKFLNEAAMLKLLAEGFAKAVEYINLKAATEEFKKIDIFANNKSVDAVLLGESGTLYDVGTNGFGNLMVSVDGGKAVSAYKIPEPFEVIYTRTYWSDGNNSTRRDSHSATYYSWNSKHADKLGKRIPTDYGREDGYIGSYTEIKKVSNPSAAEYSHADGIDSWAERYSVAGATD